MKRKLIIITLIALVASACSISLQPSGSYVDDIYYWPGDVAPAMTASDMETLSGNKSQQNKELIVVSELKENEDGSNTLNNYIYADDEPDWFGQVQAYNLENLNSENQDTLYFETEEDETVYINNYYVDDEYSYSSRIRRFHDPYYFDYDPYWNLSMGWGYYSPYSWNRPYYSYYGYWDPWYSSWYSPWGYYGGYSSWYWGYGGYPYYAHYYGYPYYDGYPYYHHHHNYTYRDYYDGERRSSRPNTTYSGGGTTRNVANAQNTRSGDATIVNKSLNPENRRSVGASNELASGQKSTITNPQNNRSVLTEKRRSTDGNAGQTTVTRNTPANQSTNSSVPAYRTRTGENNAPVRTTPGGNTNVRTDGNTRTYTPSYNTPRSNTRASYNSNNQSVPNSYQNNDRGRSTTGSAAKSGYTIPSTRSSGSNQSGSSTSPSKSYSSGSSSGSSTRSSSSYSSGSRSYTPSAPARSGSSYSGSSNRSSGSSYSGGSSSRSSGSSYSGGSSGSSSSSSGNRR